MKVTEAFKILNNPQVEEICIIASSFQEVQEVERFFEISKRNNWDSLRQCQYPLLLFVTKIHPETSWTRYQHLSEYEISEKHFCCNAANLSTSFEVSDLEKELAIIKKEIGL